MKRYFLIIGLIFIFIIVAIVVATNMQSNDANDEFFVYVKDNIDLIKEAEKMALEIIKNNTKVSYIDYGKTKNEIRDKVGKYFYQETESKPVILIMMQEV